MKTMAFIFCLLALILPIFPCYAQSSRMDKFKAELYGQKEIIAPFRVVSVDDIKNSKLVNIISKCNGFSKKLSNKLDKYLNNELLNKDFVQKERYRRSFIYLLGEQYFEKYQIFKRLEYDIEHTLSNIIENHDSIARISIYNNGNCYFTDAFKVSHGFKAFINIDQFRIRSSHYKQVLGEIKHGAKVTKFDKSYFVGISENNTSYKILLPVIGNGIYLADINYTIYKK